jgi:two-component system chemotaxis response regulator CheY
MRVLIAGKELTNTSLLDKLLKKYGDYDIAIDGLEAINAFLMAHDNNNPYSLICIDAMISKIDGIAILLIIRDLEKQSGFKIENRVKIIMVFASDDTYNIKNASRYGCDAYITKPIDVEELSKAIEKLFKTE